MSSSVQSIQPSGKNAHTSRRSRSIEKGFALAFFLVPAIVIYTWMVILPVVRAVRYSMYDWNGLGPLIDFVGLSNFQSILDDRVFQMALGNNFLILALSVLLQLPLALGLATLLQSRLPGRAAFRLLFFMPFVMSEVIAGILFNYIFRTASQGGLVNMMLQSVGIKGPAWMGDPDVVMYAVFFALTWKYFGYYVVLFLAGLQNVPDSLKEAARIDGANEIRVFRYVIVPLLRPTIVLTIYLSVIGSLQVFDLVWAMTEGGPVFASETMATYMYRSGFVRQQLGYGCAIAIVIFVIAFTFSLLYQRFVMRPDQEGVR